MEYYVGEIRIFAGTYAPDGWHFCDGSYLQISEYNALFSLLGTTFGGNGVNNFQLPNMQARVGIGSGKISGGNNTYVLGQTGGLEEVVLTSETIPAHSHVINAYTGDATIADPTNDSVLAASVPDGSGYTSVKLYASLPAGTTTPDSPLDPCAVEYQGGSQAHENMMPYTTVNYIIALNGLYPQQS